MGLECGPDTHAPTAHTDTHTQSQIGHAYARKLEHNSPSCAVLDAILFNSKQTEQPAGRQVDPLVGQLVGQLFIQVMLYVPNAYTYTLAHT